MEEKCQGTVVYEGKIYPKKNFKVVQLIGPHIKNFFDTSFFDI
jgi:hypothetical protein